MCNYFILFLTAINIHFGQKHDILVFNSRAPKTVNNSLLYSKAPVNLNWNDTGSVFLEKSEGSITVTKGSKFQVRFPERAGGTGYSWNIASGSSLCKLIHTEMIAPQHKTGMTGVPQTTVLTFNAIKRGTANIKFTFNRIWEKNVPPTETKILHLQVK